MRFAIGMILVALMVANVERQATAQTASACVTHPDTTALALKDSQIALSEGDSASVVSSGLPYRPSSIVLVNTEETCSAVVSAYNALIPDAVAAQRIGRGIVMQTGSVYILARPPERPYNTSVLYFFNSSFQLLAQVEWP